MVPPVAFQILLVTHFMCKLIRCRNVSPKCLPDFWGKCNFFVRKSQKRPFLCLKKPSVWWYAGDTFWYEMQLMVVNRARAWQGYQIQATRWRELSLLCWSTVVHFQYEYFHYRSVSPKWYRNTYDGRYFLTRLWNVSPKNKERSEIAKFLFLLILLSCTRYNCD